MDSHLHHATCRVQFRRPFQDAQTHHQLQLQVHLNRKEDEATVQAASDCRIALTTKLKIFTRSSFNRVSSNASSIIFIYVCLACDAFLAKATTIFIYLGINLFL